MAKTIDQHFTLSGGGGVFDWDLASGALSSDGAVSASLPSVAADASLDASALHAMALDASAVADDAGTIGPLLARTTDWGIGEKDLSGVQDTDIAMLIYGDPDSGGLAVINGSAAGFSMSTGYSVDGYLLSQILEGAGMTNGSESEMLNIFAHRAPITLTGQTTYTAHHTSEILGTATAETIIGSGGDDMVREGAGNDNLVGGDGNDIAWGDAGNDSMAGDDGNDQLWGGAGTDQLDGGNGADILMGGSGADTLTGGADNDVLMGGTDNDSITGGDGADTIVGGAGADSLTGGAGADKFMFVAGDAGTTATTQDTITDFTVGEDKIDLTGLSHSVVFETTDSAAPVDPKVHYEVLLISNPTGTTVEIDTTGDGVVDMTIAVTSTDAAHLTSGDFIV